MAPSSGQVLVPQAVKAFKYMVTKGAAYVRARLLPEAGAALEAIPVRIAKPIHPVAAFRQSRVQQRNFSTVRQIISQVSRPVQAARPIAGTTIRSAISKSAHAPFSSPLRPNLTGGALPRSAGGYSLGGNGVRHFSSIPAAQAHVVQNVSAAVRAFCINGFKVQYDGTDVRGTKRFRAVTQGQEKIFKSMQDSTPYSKGTTLEFRIAPTITALETDATLETGTVTGLASDFSRSLSSLALVHADLKKLSTLGSLPISYPNPYTLSIRFAGCDAAAIYAICNELGIQRGIVREDPEWDEEDGDKEVEMALLFPWAPSKSVSEDLFQPVARPAQGLEWEDMISNHEHESVPESDHDGYSMVPTSLQDGFSNPLQSPGSSQEHSFDALRDSDFDSNEDLNFGLELTQTQTVRAANSSAYEGMEGVLRFLEQCDNARN